MANRPVIEQIIMKYADGVQLSAQEKATFDEWCSRSNFHRDLPELFRDKEWMRVNVSRLIDMEPSEKHWNGVREKVCESLMAEDPKPEKDSFAYRRLMKWMAVPIIAALAAGCWFLVKEQADMPPPHVITPPTVVMDGAKHKAVLQTGYQPAQALDTRIGSIGAEYGLVYTMTDKNTLVYTNPGNKPDLIFDHQVTTGAIPLFKVVLPDGSKVSLGNNSSIRVAYAVGERKVEVKGSAIFDVTKDLKRPFIVNMDGTEIQVLGTAFSVQSNAGSKSNHIILIRGAVNVIQDQQKTVLDHPGARLGFGQGGLKPMSDVDTLSAKSWARDSDPYWSFDDASMSAVLEQFASYYQLEISNPHNVPGQRITATYSMNRSMADNIRLFALVEKPYAHIELKGTTIHISEPDGSGTDDNH